MSWLRDGHDTAINKFSKPVFLREGRYCSTPPPPPPLPPLGFHYAEPSFSKPIEPHTMIIHYGFGNILVETPFCTYRRTHLLLAVLFLHSSLQRRKNQLRKRRNTIKKRRTAVGVRACVLSFVPRTTNTRRKTRQNK